MTLKGNTCTISTYTDVSLVTTRGPHYEVDVYWKLDVSEQAINEFFDTFKAKVDIPTIQDGVGKITVEVIRQGNGSPEEVINLVEPLVHLFVVHQEGLNAFNFTETQGVPMGGVTCYLSNAYSIDALNANTVNSKRALPVEKHWLASAFEPLKGFMFGNEFCESEDISWVQPYLSGQKQPEFYKVSNLAKLRYLPVIDHKLGNIHVTSVAISEFFNLPLSRERLDREGMKALRFPYAMLKNNITNRFTKPLEKTHSHSIRLKEKFGEDSISISHQGFCIDLVRMPERAEPNYMVYGFRQFYSPKVLERLKAEGYLNS